MIKIFYLLFLSVFCFNVSAQVGIGTTNPSQASMLEVSSSVNNGSRFGGLMPPRVTSQIERDLISTTSTDIGLLVYVQSTGTFEIWNGIFWETIYTLSTQVTILAEQDFDTNINWNYSLTPINYNITNDIWDITTTLGGGTSAIDNVFGFFLGCRDLNNPNGGGNFFHEIAFENVDITNVVNARIAFDYDIFEFDANDDVQYEVFYDDISQGIITFVNGVGDLTLEGTEIIPIPNSVSNVRITLGIIQNGDGDFAGFDNFKVYGD